MNPLHAAGDALRHVFLGIPMGFVRVLFIAIPLLLMLWVLRLPTSVTSAPGGEQRWDADLRIWAWAALAIQVVIYCVL